MEKLLLRDIYACSAWGSAIDFLTYRVIIHSAVIGYIQSCDNQCSCTGSSAPCAVLFCFCDHVLVPADVVIGRYAISDQSLGSMHLDFYCSFVTVSYLGIR